MSDAAVEQPSTSEDKEGMLGSGDKGNTSKSQKKYNKKQNKKWKASKFKRKKEKKRQGDQNQNIEAPPVTAPSRGGKHGGRPKRQVFSNISKFFLPDKLPRKARVIPPTKFLLGGNISDPLNLNSLQNESESACTPKSSPVPTPPKVEVLIPPNIHDPLHLLDPVDSLEYERQLCSPMKRKNNKNRHRKRRKSTKDSGENEVCSSTEAAGAEVKIESASTSGVMDESQLNSSAPEPRVVKNLKLELGSPSDVPSRKRRCSESSTSKSKSRRLDMDKIVSPVIPQHKGGWKRGHKARPLRRSRSHIPSASEKDSEKEEKPDEERLNARKKREKYRFGNYDRYYGYRHLNEYMDVRLKVFRKNPQFFRDKDVLDVGCNVGLLTIAVAQMLQPKSVVGIDIDRNLISRARSNLSQYVRVPQDVVSETASTAEQPSKRQVRRKFSRRFSRHQTPALAQFFPISMPMCLGPIPQLQLQLEDPAATEEEATSPQFPGNVFFRTENYVPKDESALLNETQQYDLITCLSATKWIHLNLGDAGLKLAFKRMFNQLRPGGKLILEAQNWASYKKKKKVTEETENNYKTIKFFPKKFNEYLLSSEVGFSHSYPLGIPKHLSKGFSRPIQLYVKGEFTPSHAQWSDYHLSQTPYQTPRSDPHKTKYYTNILSGNLTPYASHGSYSYRMADPSPYYNPLATDSYLPSYDNETTRRTYCFASPLYSTTWSPPPNDGSRPGSLQNTPAHGSIRAENDDNYSNARPHVYPPCNDDFSDAGKSSSRSVDNDYATMSPNSPHNHVYAAEPVMSDEKDDSRSPKVNHMDYSEIPEQNGIHHDLEEEDVGSSSPVS